MKELDPELPHYAIIQGREVTLLETIPSVDGLDTTAVFEDAQGIKRFVLSQDAIRRKISLFKMHIKSICSFER